VAVQDIVAQVLQDAGFGADDFRFALSGSYKPREYCVQYRETDLNFISRLLEFEGISFFFDHGDDHETLVITDDRTEYPFIDGESNLSYHSGAGLLPHANAETVRQFICREKIVTGKVVLKDYNYRTPETTLRAESQLNADMPGLYYEYGQHFKDNSEGARLAMVRNEEIECNRRVMTGQSDCVGLCSGFRFSLQDHYRSDLNGDYLLTQISHFGSQGAGFAAPMGGVESPTYRNEFICIPAEVQYRPSRITPEPRIPGIMTAKIETAGGDYAHIDELGRYKVKMPFDVSDRNGATASRALRMAQPYSGANYGVHFPNRANAEMVWACIDGNVDRPLGLSTVPNPSNLSPAVAFNKAQCVIRTAGQNELTFDDMIGSENIYLHSTKDWTIDVVNDKKQTVGHDETLSVTNERHKTIGSHETEKIGGNQSSAVDGDAVRNIAGNSASTVSGNKSSIVEGNVDEDIKGNKTSTISGNLSEKIGANRTSDVDGDVTENIDGNKTIDVAKNLTETISGDIKQTGRSSKTEALNLDKTLNVGKDYKVEVGGTMNVKVTGYKNETVMGLKTEENLGAKVLVVGATSIETVGLFKEVIVTTGYFEDRVLAGKRAIKAKEILLECGKSSIQMKDGEIVLTNGQVTLKMSGATVDIS
jgi:type VI secretion system secreted protein VgrG